MKVDTDLLEIQDQVAAKNTWYRAPKVAPSIQKISSSTFRVRTVEDEVELGVLEEAILNVIVSFKFMPYWIVQRWFNQMNRNPNKNAGDEIKKWVRIGLVWVETSTTGVYLRPTRFLLDMFKEKQTNYSEIPYNTLTHTISEAQLYFDLTVGNPRSEMWQIVKNEETLPRYHPLLVDLNENHPPNESGTIVIREADFRKNFKSYKPKQLQENEELIKSQIRSGKRYTEELTNFSLFPIVQPNIQNSEKKGEIYTQNPDLIVPLPRKHITNENGEVVELGRPQSYAIEIELSPKTADRYNDIMIAYKNNIKFGKLFYLCSSQRIARLVKESFQNVKGLGTCELYILPFEVPSMDVENFSREAERLQMELVKDSLKNNV